MCSLLACSPENLCGFLNLSLPPSPPPSLPQYALRGCGDWSVPCPVTAVGVAHALHMMGRVTVTRASRGSAARKVRARARARVRGSAARKVLMLCT